jgi:hypothetical protein
MGANLVLTGRLTQLLCCSVSPVTCVTRERTKHRADGALHSRVGLLGGLCESLDIELVHLDMEITNPLLAPLAVAPCPYCYGCSGRLPRTNGGRGRTGWTIQSPLHRGISSAHSESTSAPRWGLAASGAAPGKLHDVVLCGWHRLATVVRPRLHQLAALFARRSSREATLAAGGLTMRSINAAKASKARRFSGKYSYLS